jgi:predicted kinase
MVNAPAPLVVVSGPSGVGKTTVTRVLAAGVEKSALVEADTFMAFISAGWVEPNLPQASDQNDVIGLALVAATVELAAGGYTTVVDGHLFPPALEYAARAGRRRGVPVHYAVLRADLDTCWARARDRPEGRWALERESFDALHGRFAALDLDDRHDIDATGRPDLVAATVLAAVQDGTLRFTDR